MLNTDEHDEGRWNGTPDLPWPSGRSLEHGLKLASADKRGRNAELGSLRSLRQDGVSRCHRGAGAQAVPQSLIARKDKRDAETGGIVEKHTLCWLQNTVLGSGSRLCASRGRTSSRPVRTGQMLAPAGLCLARLLRVSISGSKCTRETKLAGCRRRPGLISARSLPSELDQLPTLY